MNAEFFAIHPEMNPIEKEIVLTILEDASKRGYTITVYDGGDTAIENCSDKKDIFAAMYSTDEDTLFFDLDGKQVGWLFLVYGNRECVVSDYADNAAMEDLLKNVDTLVEKYS